MMPRPLAGLLGLLTVIAVVSCHAVPAAAAQQQVAMADRSPRFFYGDSSMPQPQPVDADRMPTLRRKVSLRLVRATLSDALTEITRQTGLRFVYSRDAIKMSGRVDLEAKHITVAAALTEILLGEYVDVLFSSATQAALVKRPGAPTVGQRNASAAVSGHVVAKAGGASVVGAGVVLAGKDTALRTVTSDSGAFLFPQVPAGTYQVSVRYIGFQPATRKIVVESTSVRVDFTLDAATPRLQDLVTTATGRRRRMDIANDITTINVDSVMQVAPIQSVTDLLRTRVPGLTIQRTSGAPGDPSRLRLRGASSSLRSNDPIFVVDGVRLYSDQSALRSGNLARSGLNTGDSAVGGSSSATPSPLDYLDPNSIETIEVFKGPSAATLYGPDAANGVIVITTKRGRPGPARWTATLRRGRTQIEGDYPQLLFRWGHDNYFGAPRNCPANNLSSGLPCEGDSLVSFQLLNDPALTVLDHGSTGALSLGASGGTQALTYAVTGSYQDEPGFVKLPDYEVERYQSQLGVTPPKWMRWPQHLRQWGVTSNIVARLSPKMDLTLVTALSRTMQQKSSLQDQLGTLMSTYLDRASGIYTRVDQNGTTTTGQSVLADYYQRSTDAATAFTNSLSFGWRPRAWLELSSRAGLNIDHRADQLFVPRGPVQANSNGDSTGYVNDAQGLSLVSTFDAQALAHLPLGRGFQFQVAVGTNYHGSSVRDVAGGSSDLAPGSSSQGAKTEFLRQTQQSETTFGWYVAPSLGSPTFNIDLGLRLDGGSSYGSGTSGLHLPKFPKLGFSYLLSDEPWFPFAALFQSFRVRVAYGRAGRQPGALDRLRLYGAPSQTFAEGETQTEALLRSLGNTEVRPERTTELEGGFEAALFDNRLRLDVTGYRKTTDDALQPVPVAPSVYGEGVTIAKNIGAIRNTGLELTVGADLLRAPQLVWSTQVQFTQNRNVVVALGPGVTPYYYSGSNQVGGERVAPGYPLFGRWSYPIIGYADGNGDGVLQASEVQLGDTAVYVGSTLPNYEADLSSTVSLFHGMVVVDAVFQYQNGLSQKNEVASALAPYSRGNQVPETPLTEQAATVQVFTVNHQLSDYNWIQTVNTFRFHSLGVRYAVPVRLAHVVGAQQLSVGLQGGNLGLWTNYRGLDPDVNAFGTGNSVTDTGILPAPRVWQIQVNATY